MNILEKIENAINSILISFNQLVLNSIPKPVKKIYHKIVLWIKWLAINFKQIPSILKFFFTASFLKIKSTALSLNYKDKLIETYSRAVTQAKESSPGLGKLRILILTPFLIVGQWLKGLSAVHSLLLLTFTTGSILAFIGIGYSGKKLVTHHLDVNRYPASVEVIEYGRPGYYKKESRHFDLTNLRLPVYIAKINEIQSVDIDFTATLSNRNSRIFLEKKEIQLRDHLILQVEPAVASFTLEEEGKEIIRQKVFDEINAFLKNNEIEGEVIEVKITYVLAN